MSSFFKNMNLARGIILFAVIGSIALGFLGWKQQQALNDLKDDLDSETPKLVRELMRLGHQHTALARAKTKEGLSGQNDFRTYITSAANKDGVDLGEIKLNGQDMDRGKGVKDITYTIIPADREHHYERYRIANFLYALERDSHRVKVTRVKMNVAEKNVKPHEIPDDLWTFEASVTSRQKTEEKPPAK